MRRTRASACLNTASRTRPRIAALLRIRRRARRTAASLRVGVRRLAREGQSAASLQIDHLVQGYRPPPGRRSQSSVGDAAAGSTGRKLRQPGRRARSAETPDRPALGRSIPRCHPRRNGSPADRQGDVSGGACDRAIWLSRRRNLPLKLDPAPRKALRPPVVASPRRPLGRGGKLEPAARSVWVAGVIPTSSCAEAPTGGKTGDEQCHRNDARCPG